MEMEYGTFFLFATVCIFFSATIFFWKKSRGLESKYRILKFQLGWLESKSKTDPLTMVGNRDALMEHLAFTAMFARVFRRRLAIVIADADHFKQVNDTYGHPTGDGVLKVIARAIAFSVNGGNFVGRYGGEEFMILALVDSVEEAAALAETARAAVAGATYPDGIRQTASFGVAVFNPAVEGDTVEAALTRADQALYAAKKAGRNCVRFQGVE